MHKGEQPSLPSQPSRVGDGMTPLEFLVACYLGALASLWMLVSLAGVVRKLRRRA